MFNLPPPPKYGPETTLLVRRGAYHMPSASPRMRQIKAVETAILVQEAIASTRNSVSRDDKGEGSPEEQKQWRNSNLAIARKF